MVSLTITLSLLLAQPPTQLKPPPSKLEEQRTFHARQYRGTPAEVRAQSWLAHQNLLRSSRFSQLRWRNVGPERQGGRVIAIESPTEAPRQLLIAYATGGLWRTEDDGITWTPLFHDQSAFGIGDIAVTPDGKTIWVGSGESNSQRTVYSGTGVFKSSDAGATWQHAGLPESHHIGRVLIHPKRPETVYVAAMGHLYSANPERGVFKTEDGGKTWHHALKIDERTGAIDLAMHPRNPDILLAAAWDNDRRAWNFKESGLGSGVYRSEDGGKTWRLVEGLPHGEFAGRTGIAFAPSDPRVVYALVDWQGGDPDTFYKDENQPSGVLTPYRFLRLTEEEFGNLEASVLGRFVENYLPRGTEAGALQTEVKEKKKTLGDVRKLMEQRNPNVFAMDSTYVELWRSDDGGKTWRKPHRGGFEIDYGYYFGKLAVNPSNPNDVVALGLLAYRSRDGGKTFAPFATGNHVDHHALWFDPKNPKRMVNGNDGGPYLSEDDGRTWRHLNNLPVGQSTTVAVDNKRPYNIITGLQDNGTLMGPSSYRPGASDLSLWRSINGGDGSAIAVDPREDGNVIYSSSQFGSFNAWDQKANERWGLNPPGRGNRYNWIAPILISPHHPDIVYIGSQKLSRSLDKGRTWEDLSGDLTKNLPNGDVPYSTLKDISESPLKFGLIYVGADDGTVNVTRDHGATWKSISTPQPDKWVSRVVASRHDRGTVYVAQTGYREDDFKAYLWRSKNYGDTWDSITGNLPDEPINVIREDPEKKDWLYVGTDLGVYVSFDAGQTWEALMGGLPTQPVHDLVVQPRERDLVIATHGRSCWVLSLKPFDDIDDDVRKADVFLWSIDDMVRSNRWGYERRSAWSSEGDRKPTVSGRFWSRAGGAGRVAIKDKAGKVVKELVVEAVPGFNFFTVDLELTPPKRNTIDPKKWDPKTLQEKLKDPYEAERPTYLPAGEYTIEVTVDGKAASKPWKLTGF